MPCFHPIEGYRAPSGKVVFNRSQGYSDVPVTVPCGQCIGCRIDRSRMWAARCIHESKMHDENCFITLTYSPENEPGGGSLVLGDFQKFMKRFRKHLGPKKIKAYYCGEYGDKGDRPHYHACIFGHDFEDRKLWKQGDYPLFISDTLASIWPFGFSTVGNLTYETAAYTARYCLKKINGKNADQHYEVYDIRTGETYHRTPEFAHPSKGIGKSFYLKFKSDFYPSDFLIINGKKHNIPKYYDNLFNLEHPADFISPLDHLKLKRRRKAAEHKDNNTPERLAVRETVLKARLAQNNRDL